MHRSSREHRIRRPSGFTPSGFTMIELVMVLVMIGVLLALAMPRVGVERALADTAAQGLRVTLQQAQRTALLRQHDVLVSFDTAAGAIRVTQDRNNNRMVDSGERSSRTPLEERARFAAPVRRVGGGAPAGTIAGVVASVDDMPTIVMRRDGSASVEAELYLAVGEGARREWRALTIARPTARVEWFRGSDDGAWKRGGL